MQIRYKGAKGVVLLNEEIDPNTVVLRKSMIKYECRHPNAKKYFDVLDYNKYKPGYLNRQIIVLLKSLKISDEVFIRFQDEYIKRIQDLNYTKEDNIIRVLDNADIQGK